MHAGQDSAAERVIKKLKRHRELEFKKKGHERQFLFNDEAKDKIENTTATIKKVEPSTPQPAGRHWRKLKRSWKKVSN